MSVNMKANTKHEAIKSFESRFIARKIISVELIND
jgi:hypothetical protein